MTVQNFEKLRAEVIGLIARCEVDERRIARLERKLLDLYQRHSCTGEGCGVCAALED